MSGQKDQDFARPPENDHLDGLAQLLREIAERLAHDESGAVSDQGVDASRP